MRTVGIDLASQAKKTAACGIDWGDGTATVSSVEVGVDDQRAKALVKGADIVGIDAPFGWPLPFVEMVRRHHAEGGVPREWTPGHVSPLRFRRTDLVVRRRLNLIPLSVSSDRIAITAMRCANLLDHLGVVDRSGRGRVVEVYPAAALKSWTLRWNGYKGSGNVAILADLLASVLAACPWLTVPPPLVTLCKRNDHAFDALVTALVVRAVTVGLTERPADDDLALARTEGWIAIPFADSLARLAEAEATSS